jgi:hypothetical protein
MALGYVIRIQADRQTPYKRRGKKMKISGRSIYIALVAVPVLWAVSQPMPCSVRAIASSWYPEYLNIPDRHFREIEGQKSLRIIHVNRMKTGNDIAGIEMVYQLLPSRKLLASLRQLGGFQLPGDARYDCNKTPDQVLQSVQ